MRPSFIVVSAEGEASLREDLTNEEIARLAAADCTIVYCEAGPYNSTFRAFSVDEDGGRTQLPVNQGRAS